jgi:hypothetical protein
MERRQTVNLDAAGAFRGSIVHASHTLCAALHDLGGMLHQRPGFVAGALGKNWCPHGSWRRETEAQFEDERPGKDFPTKAAAGRCRAALSGCRTWGVAAAKNIAWQRQ